MSRRVVFYVRCHGEPDEELEEMIMNRFCDAVDIPERGWGILTIGRSYYDDERIGKESDITDEIDRERNEQ